MKVRIDYGQLKRMALMSAAVVSSRPASVAKEKWTDIDRIGPDSNFKIVFEKDKIKLRAYCDLVVSEVSARALSSDDFLATAVCVDARSFVAQVVALREDQDHSVSFAMNPDDRGTIVITSASGFVGKLRVFPVVAKYFHDFEITHQLAAGNEMLHPKLPLVQALALASTIHDEDSAHRRNLFRVQNGNFFAKTFPKALVRGDHPDGFDFELVMPMGVVDKALEFLAADNDKDINISKATISDATYYKIETRNGYIAVKHPGTSTEPLKPLKALVMADPKASIVIQTSMMSSVLDRAKAFLPFNAKPQDKVIEISSSDPNRSKALAIRSFVKWSKQQSSTQNLITEETFANDLGRSEGGESSTALLEAGSFRTTLTRFSQTLGDTVFLGFHGESGITFSNFSMIRANKGLDPVAPPDSENSIEDKPLDNCDPNPTLVELGDDSVMVHDLSEVRASPVPAEAPKDAPTRGLFAVMSLGVLRGSHSATAN